MGRLTLVLLLAAALIACVLVLRPHAGKIEAQAASVQRSADRQMSDSGLPEGAIPGFRARRLAKLGTAAPDTLGPTLCGTVVGVRPTIESTMTHRPRLKLEPYRWDDLPAGSPDTIDGSADPSIVYSVDLSNGRVGNASPPVARSPRGQLAALDEDGTFEIGLPAGRWRVSGDKRNPFRIDEQVVDVLPEGVTEVAFEARYRSVVRFRVTARDASGGWPERRRWALHASRWDDPAGAWKRIAGGPSRARSVVGSTKDLELTLYPGRLRFTGEIRGRRGRPHIPATMASAEYTLGAHTDTSVPIPLSIVLDSAGAIATVRGRVANGVRERISSFDVLARTSEDGAIEERLALDGDGVFHLSVDTRAVAGPQILIRSKLHGDTLGPFAIVPGEIDLGDLRFAGRATGPGTRNGLHAPGSTVDPIEAGR